MGHGMRAEADDAALLRGVAAGDEQALTFLYDRHAAWHAGTDEPPLQRSGHR